MSRPTDDGPLKPTGKIEPQPWLTSPATRAVLEALGAGGAEVRFVGGCVRDAVLKRPVADIDIATPEPPTVVIERLQAAGIKALATGIDHGTVSALVGGQRFEITTLRIDVETDGRHARVAFTDDWSADARRRDFVINTLSANLDGDVYDPFGAIDDLAYGIVRFVGNPRRRIEEDLLRLLRFFRFHATYAKPPPDIDALAACRVLAPRLPELSGERVRDELFRILMAPNPADTVHLMRGERILEHILPEAGDVGRLRMLSWLDTTAIKVDSVIADPLRRLGAVLDTDRAGAEAAAGRLRLSRNQTRRLATMAGMPFRMAPDDAIEDRRRTLRRALRRAGAEAVRDLVLLAWAGELATALRRSDARTRAWLSLIEEVDGWTPPRFPLTGGDVTERGVAQGPRVGELLAAVEAWWEDDDYRPGRRACLEKLHALMGNQCPGS